MPSSSSDATYPCSPEPKKMQAMTAILNPNTVGRDHNQKMMLFQSLTANDTLGYDQFNTEDSEQAKAQEQGGVKGYYGVPPNSAPVLMFQSKLISMLVSNTVNVYGVIEKGDICLMSPVFMPLPSSHAENGIIAGCSDGDKASWLFFQKDGQIHEQSLSDLTAKPSPIKDIRDAKQNTDIVAFWDGQHRWIAYQKDNNEVGVKCLDTTESYSITDSDKITGGCTKLAAAQTPLQDGNRIYIYMTTKDFELYRTHADVISDGGLKFNPALRLKPIVNVADYTWFDVEADAKQKINLIYTVATKDTKITCFKDSWAK